jgi:hypothetical protein
MFVNLLWLLAAVQLQQFSSSVLYQATAVINLYFGTQAVLLCYLMKVL